MMSHLSFQDPPDEDTAAALGIIYGDANVNPHYTELTGRKTDFKFYENVPIIMTQAFGLPIIKAKPIEQTTTGFGRRYHAKYPAVRYTAPDLITYLFEVIGFPRNKREKVTANLPETIINANERVKKEFLIYLLAAKASFRPSGGDLTVSNRGRNLLDDLVESLGEHVPTDGYRIKNLKGNHWKLFLKPMTTELLWQLGFLSENAHIRKRARAYYEELMKG